MRDRKRTLITIIAVAVVALGAGVGLSQLIMSPADAAADREPPEAGPITVPVEIRELQSRIVTRGDAAFAGSVGVARGRRARRAADRHRPCARVAPPGASSIEPIAALRAE